MKTTKKRILSTISVLAMLFSCKGKMIKLSDTAVYENAKFHSAVVDIRIDDFNNLGFTLGDSCDVLFSNGYSLEDVPYYNGYYVKNAAPVIVAYPNDTYLTITLNNTGIWSLAGLEYGDKVNITLKEKGKYLSTQEALSQNYSLLREEYDNDEEFSNFRVLKGGKLKDNLFYRGASPVDNSRNRAKITDSLLEKYGIGYVIDLADSEEDMETYLKEENFDSPYTKSLYGEDRISFLALGSGYTTQAYKESLVIGLKSLLGNDGPYYIHCMEGKDRTGFVSMLILALAGASYEEMCLDYMKTYENYYKITRNGSKEKYDAIVSLYFDSFIQAIYDIDDVSTYKNMDFTRYAKDYLVDGGMTDEEVDALIKKICK